MTNDCDHSITVWAMFKYYYPNFAGAAIQGHQILRRLAERGFHVRILAAADHSASSAAGQEVELDGLTIQYLPVVRRRDWDFIAGITPLWRVMTFLNALLAGLSLSLRSALVLWRQGRRNDVVQLYSFGTFSCFVLWLARVRGMHPALRMTLLGSDDPGAFQKGAKRVLRTPALAAFHQAEAIIAISSALEDSCQTAGIDSSKILRIPNGVDLKRFHPIGDLAKRQLREALGLRTDRRYIVFVGSAKRRKGIDVLIKAFIRVAQQIGGVELLIVGPSDLSDHARHSPTRRQLVFDLKEELAQAGCSSRVHWMGKVDNVQQYLQVADVFCLPTRREGMPNAVAEAMAVGLPVIAARLEGITTDLIRPGREGLLIAEHDPCLYADAMLKLLENPTTARALGESAQARVEGEFSLELAAERYAELYEKLTSVKKP